jgi:gliding motility-associated transport system permease protein
MHNILTISQREFKLYFSSPVAYVLGAALYLILGVLFYLNLQYAAVQTGFVPGIDAILGPLATLLLFIVPAITTRLLAEERRLGTIELLLTAPVRDWELVIGKWLGAFLLLLTIVSLTIVYALLLNQFVQPGIDQGPLVSGYLGLILVIAAMVAIGVAISSLFSNQIAAFITTMLTLVFLWWIIGPISQVLGPTSSSSQIWTYLDFQGHYFQNMIRGIIDLGDLIFYLSVTALALFLATMSIEIRRWR